VFVVAEQVGLNAVVIEQPSGGAGIFAGDPVGFFQEADGAVGDVLEVADGRRDYVEAARSAFMITWPKRTKPICLTSQMIEPDGTGVLSS
jgi:hypothetical protein